MDIRGEVVMRGEVTQSSLTRWEPTGNSSDNACEDGRVEVGWQRGLRPIIGAWLTQNKARLDQALFCGNLALFCGNLASRNIGLLTSGTLTNLASRSLAPFLTNLAPNFLTNLASAPWLRSLAP